MPCRRLPAIGDLAVQCRSGASCCCLDGNKVVRLATVLVRPLVAAINALKLDLISGKLLGKGALLLAATFKQIAGPIGVWHVRTCTKCAGVVQW